jgi:hypothetical protein
VPAVCFGALAGVVFLIGRVLERFLFRSGVRIRSATVLICVERVGFEHRFSHTVFVESRRFVVFVPIVSRAAQCSLKKIVLVRRVRQGLAF